MPYNKTIKNADWKKTNSQLETKSKYMIADIDPKLQ